MAQGRSTKIISTIKWIRTSRLSIKNSLSLSVGPELLGRAVEHRLGEEDQAWDLRPGQRLQVAGGGLRGEG